MYLTKSVKRRKKMKHPKWEVLGKNNNKTIKAAINGIKDSHTMTIDDNTSGHQLSL